MPKTPVEAGTKWGGLNKLVDPVELTPEQSPDCANVFFYDQTLGLLGPRLGKAYAGASEKTIWGVIPYNIAGQIGSLVAYGDSTSTSINLLNLYAVLYPHGGWGDGGKGAPDPVHPVVSALGFYTTVEVAKGPGASPQTDTHSVNAGTLTAVPVNGATTVIATAASGLFQNEGSCLTEVEFDSDGVWIPATVSIAEPGGCCYGLTLTNEATPVDCTGKTALTGVRCTATEPGETVELSGIISIMGVKV
jgi:hypothetical protein